MWSACSTCLGHLAYGERQVGLARRHGSPAREGGCYRWGMPLLDGRDIIRFVLLFRAQKDTRQPGTLLGCRGLYLLCDLTSQAPEGGNTRGQASGQGRKDVGSQILWGLGVCS